MTFRLLPIALLVGCSAAEAENPEVTFRQCVLKQARAVSSADRPSYAVAEKFGRNCVSQVKSVSDDKQQQFVRDYACALSQDNERCSLAVD